MTPARFTECLEAIRWTEHTLARALECDLGLVEAMAAGEAVIPSRLAAWLEVLAQCHAAAEMEKPRSLKGKKLRS